MSRQVSHIILSFLLLVSTAGLAVSKHYCGEHLISTDLFDDSDSCCDNGNCCHDEHTFYQVDTDFTAPGFILLPHVFGMDLFLGLPDASTTGYYRQGKPDDIEEREIPPPSGIQEVLSMRQAWLL